MLAGLIFISLEASRQHSLVFAIYTIDSRE
jgi:hypothetical protein